MKKLIMKNTKTPMLAALLCVALLLVSMFLPYITAEEDYREVLEAMEQDTSLSLYDLATAELDNNDDSVAKILGLLAGLAVAAAVTAFFRKPVLLLLADLLTTAWSVMIFLIFSNGPRGYVMSIGIWLIFLACAGLLISAVWMLAAKIKAKKTYRQRNAKPQNI